MTPLHKIHKISDSAHSQPQKTRTSASCSQNLQNAARRLMSRNEEMRVASCYQGLRSKPQTEHRKGHWLRKVMTHAYICGVAHLCGCTSPAPLHLHSSSGACSAQLFTLPQFRVLRPQFVLPQFRGPSIIVRAEECCNGNSRHSLAPHKPSFSLPLCHHHNYHHCNSPLA